MPLRTFDFAPLYRSTVGFDRLFSMLDQLDGVEGSSNYPYDIERTGENVILAETRGAFLDTIRAGHKAA
jgi:HSP20 family molecular chaperone IbpA